VARNKTPNLTEAELKLMNVIWELGDATVADVLAALKGKPVLAYNTVLTTMRILEQKGYLDRTKRGRSHSYRARVSRLQARSKAVQHMVSSLFDGSPELLVLNVLKDERLSPNEIERLKKMIDAKE
jgi:predicted transcriptional regulator